jgi:hypothetical protein
VVQFFCAKEWNIQLLYGFCISIERMIFIELGRRNEFETGVCFGID